MASELQVTLLAEALGKCLVASGIVRADAELTGPHLLMFAEDLERLLTEANTRPAPAVTDTGLVTAKVEHRVHFGEDGNPTEWREGYGMGLYPQEPIVRVEVREYVTRSQAEELLAAERAKYRDAMEKLVESQRETLVWQQRAINLKSDNAAKDKLLKEAFHV